MKKTIAAVLSVALSGCATVRQQDLDAWVGKPVIALDTHSFFLTLPMIKTISSDGVEIRNYSNKQAYGSCAGAAGMNANSALTQAAFNSFSACTSQLVGCDNIFYIKDGRVLEYAPVGRCKTDETVQPEPRYLRLRS